MLSERTIINGLLVVAGMILGPYLIILTFEVNQVALLSFAGIVFLFALFFVVKDRISAFPLFGLFLGGTLNFIPLGLTAFELLNLTTILYYFINYVALKRRAFEVGPRSFLFPMLVIGGIVVVHDHSLKVFGGGQEGSRQGFVILLSLIGYLCAINIPTSPASFWNRVPWWCFFFTCLGSIPYILTTFFPNLAPYLFFVSGNVNYSSYLESIGGKVAEETDRNAAFLQMGTALQGILVAYFPINTWWRPKRWILIVLSILCFYATLSGGYRGGLFTFMLVTFTSAICYSRWRVLILLPLLAIVPLGVIYVQNDHPAGLVLPGSVQRAMSFLPGRWDPDVLLTTESSNGFRDQIKQIYISEYLYKNPWLGKGFSFDPSEPEGLDAMSKTPGVTDSFYFSVKAFIVSKNFHIGWISLYDAVGIIGGIAFLVATWSIIWMASSFIFSRNVDTNSLIFPAVVWIFCNFTATTVCFFTTFGSFSQSVTMMCTDAILLVHVFRLIRSDTIGGITPSPQMAMSMPRKVEAFSRP